MTYGYIRVSTRGQLDGNSIEEQTEEILKRYEKAELVVEAASGHKDREKFNELIERMDKGDLIVVTKLDRFCRSVKEGLSYIDVLRAKGINVHILNMGLIEDSPIGRLIITNLLAYAEFERANILERTQSGKVIARRNKDYKEGRPYKYSMAKLSHAMELLQSHSYSQVEAMTGISKSTLTRHKRRLKNGD